MKKIMLTVLAIMLMLPLALPLAAQEADADAEKKAIVETARNYIDGWYEGNVERMDKALHPDLVKRVMRKLPSGNEITTTISKKTMIEYTRLGAGKQSPNKDKPTKVEVLAVDKTIAMARCVSGDYYDYLQLVKSDNGWQIINVIWVPLEERPQGR